MNSKTKAAPNGSGNTSRFSSVRRNKDNKRSLPPQRKRLFSLLSDGFPRSTAEISTELNLCDPRGLIRDLRKSGNPFSDFWVNGAYGRRFKRYFIRKEAGNGNK